MALIESIVLPIIAAIQKGLSGLPFSSGTTVLLLHTFTAADSTTTVPAADTGQAVAVSSNAAPVGIYGIQSNAAYLANINGASDYTYLTMDAGASNGTIEWVMLPVTSGTAMASTGGTFRFQDTANHWIWDWNASSGAAVTFSVYPRIAGTYTNISASSSAIDTTLGGTLRLVLNGTTMTFFWNGVQVLQILGHTETQNATKVGLSHSNGTRGTRWDSLKVTT